MYTHVQIIALARVDDVAKTATVLQALEHKCDEVQQLEVGVHGKAIDRSAHIALIARFADRDAFEAFESNPEWAKTHQYLKRVRAKVVRVDF